MRRKGRRIGSSSPSPHWPGLTAKDGNDLLIVLERCALMCCESLDTFEAFHPFGVRLQDDDLLTLIGRPLPTSKDIDPLVWVYKHASMGADNFKAVAIAHAAGDDNDTLMRIHCEHRAGRAFRVVVRWEMLVDDKVRMKAPVVQPVDPVIWGAA